MMITVHPCMLFIVHVVNAVFIFIDKQENLFSDKTSIFSTSYQNLVNEFYIMCITDLR